MRTVITFGTFDLFHVGHLKILERAKEHGTRLVVGISSDELNNDMHASAEYRAHIIKVMAKKAVSNC